MKRFRHTVIILDAIVHRQRRPPELTPAQWQAIVLRVRQSMRRDA